MVLFCWRGERCYVSLAPPFFSPRNTAPPMFGEVLSPRVGALYSFPMRDFMLHTNSARLSVGAPGVVDGSVSSHPLLGDATIGGSFARGEYTQERQ